MSANPQPSAQQPGSLYALLKYFELVRMQKGASYCRKKLIGPLRRAAGAPLPQNALPFHSDIEGETWAKALAAHCRDCCGCKLSD